MTVILDGRRMTTRANAHTHLAEQLSFPDWYGRNLDALYDLLTSGVEADQIELIHMEDMLREMGAYGRRLLQTLRDAAEAGGPELIERTEIVPQSGWEESAPETVCSTEQPIE